MEAYRRNLPFADFVPQRAVAQRYQGPERGEVDEAEGCAFVLRQHRSRALFSRASVEIAFHVLSLPSLALVGADLRGTFV